MFSKKPIEEIPEEHTSIWSCSNEDCNGWMRSNFSFEEEPLCPLCHAPMTNDTKMLPILTNHTR